MTLTFITGNKSKFDQLNKIIDNIKQFNYDLPEYQGAPEFIVEQKCKFAKTMIKGPILVEDTCLIFNELSNDKVLLPGPYIKWFIKLGLPKVVSLLDNYSNKTACALTTIAYNNGKDSEILLFSGKTYGTITLPRGCNGFGWDPIFIPIGSLQTYAEMNSDIKDTFSERVLAAIKLKDFLNTNFNTK